MGSRIIDVTAYTTFDLLDGEVVGQEFSEDAFAVLNVTAPEDDPEHVELRMEMDHTDLSEVPQHADGVSLAPDQARELAAELEKYANRVEEG